MGVAALLSVQLSADVRPGRQQVVTAVLGFLPYTGGDLAGAQGSWLSAAQLWKWLEMEPVSLFLPFK